MYHGTSIPFSSRNTMAEANAAPGRSAARMQGGAAHLGFSIFTSRSVVESQDMFVVMAILAIVMQLLFHKFPTLGMMAMVVFRLFSLLFVINVLVFS